MKVWTKDTIHQLLDANPKAVYAAMRQMQKRQTAAEQAQHATTESNGIGWSKYDAEWMSEMIKNVDHWGSLTPRQLAPTRNKLKRYWRQLVEIANENEQKKAALAAAMEPTIERAETPEEAEARAIAEDEARYHAMENVRDMEQEYERMARKFAWQMSAGAFA